MVIQIATLLNSQPPECAHLANPALGYASDLLVAAGGAAVLAETPEIFGAEQVLTRRAILGIPNLLLVDDDYGQRIDTFYTAPMESLGQAYEVWHVSSQRPPDSMLSRYANVIWFTGGSRTDVVPSASVDSIISYLEHGGHFMVTSQDFVQRLSERGLPNDSLLLSQYLKVWYFLRENDHREDGLAGTVFDSLNFNSAGIGGANNQMSQDALLVRPGGTPLLNYRSSHVAAVGAEGGYRALTVGFGMEGINDSYPTLYNSRLDFMRAALRYLLTPVSVSDEGPELPAEMSLEQNYPNPFNPATQIAFEVPSAGPVELAIYDVLGRLIDKPVNGVLKAGKQIVTWDGSAYSSGIYFYRLTVGGHSTTKRMTLAK